MKIRLIYNHIEHHAQHSGYDMMARYTQGQAYEYGPLYRLAQKHATWKRLQKYEAYHTNWYGGDQMRRELEIIGRVSLPRKTLYHLYYAENDLRIASLWRWRWNNKLVASFHQPPEFLDKHVEDKAYIRGLDAVVVVSQSQVEYMSKFLPREKVFHVPHGVHTEYWSPQSGLGREEVPTFVFVGVWLRDLEMAKATIRRVAEMGVKARFKLITAADRHAEFEGLPNTELLAGIPDEELLRSYRQASALFLPLSLSTANNAILEAMSCGTPIITTRSGGIPEYVNEDCGIMVEPGDVQAAADAIKQLSENPSQVEELGRGARSRAQDFAWEKVGATMDAVYRKVLGLKS